MSQDEPPLRPATKADLYELARRRLYMDPDWMLYVPVWAMRELFRLFGTMFTHLVTFPEEKTESIFVRAAAPMIAGELEEGALEISFNEQHTAGSFNLHYAAVRFHKRPGKGRKLEIPVKVVDHPKLGPVLWLNMKDAVITKGNARDALNLPPLDEAAPAKQPDGPAPEAEAPETGGSE